MRKVILLVKKNNKYFQENFYIDLLNVEINGQKMINFDYKAFHNSYMHLKKIQNYFHNLKMFSKIKKAIQRVIGLVNINIL